MMTGNTDECTCFYLEVPWNGGPMHLTSKPRRVAETMQLRTAVLCVDCESLISNRTDRCPVCGSQSVFCVAPMLGGSVLRNPAMVPGADRVKFDLQLGIDIKHVSGGDLNPLLDEIANTIRHLLGPNRAFIHVNVDPVQEVADEERRAA